MKQPVDRRVKVFSTDSLGLTKSPVIRFLLGVFVALFSVSSLALGQPRELPAAPPDHNFIYDEVKLLDHNTQSAIGQIQKIAFEEHDTPIVVVVIESLRSYGWNGDIEKFSERWFNTWGIGAEGSNKGILLLVAVRDRQARIELGADWEHRWDRHTQIIMERKILPLFKDNDYASGIILGVTELAKMATHDPGSTPPPPTWSESAAQTLESAQTFSILKGALFLNLIGVGVILIIVGIFVPSQRKFFIRSGVTVILMTFFSLLVAVVLVILIRGGGGYSSRGGFSGGFSVGGGAIGRW